MFRFFFRLTIALALLACSLGAESLAGLQFYYDPDTGNVSFDTTDTRTGAIYLYALKLRTLETSTRFISDNHVRLSNSTLYLAREDTVQETTLDAPLRGLFTVGNVLPSDLSEETWLGLFNENSITGEKRGDPDAPIRGVYGYVDQLGGGPAPQAEFIYGAPAGEYDNRWSLVDPSILDWAEEAQLIYVASSGEVLIDTTGPNSGYISSYFLQSDDEFLFENYHPVTDSVFVDVGSRTLALLANAIEPDRYNLGRILEPGMSLSELETTLTKAEFLAQAGFSSARNFDYEVDGITMKLVYQAVPEPSGFLLLVFSLAILTSHRKRLDT